MGFLYCLQAKSVALDELSCEIEVVHKEKQQLIKQLEESNIQSSRYWIYFYSVHVQHIHTKSIFLYIRLYFIYF